MSQIFIMSQGTLAGVRSNVHSLNEQTLKINNAIRKNKTDEKVKLVAVKTLKYGQVICLDDRHQIIDLLGFGMKVQEKL